MRRRIFLIVMTILLGLGVIPAQASDLYTVEGVEVDVTGDSATEAQMKAMSDGEQQAFVILMERLSAQGTSSPQMQPEAQDISAMVRGFEVANEKITANRYRALLTISFNPDAVRGLLQGAKVSYSDHRRRPVLVIPVLHQPGGVTLWQEPNPWRVAWDNLQRREGLVPIVLPLGDLEDVAMADPQTVLTRRYEALAPLARKYGAEDVLIAESVVRKDPVSGQQSFDVNLYLLSPRDGKQSHTSYLVTEGDMLPVYQQAARDIAGRLEKDWKTSTQVSQGQDQQMPVLIPLNGLGDWIQIRRTLQNAGFVDRLRVVAMSTQQADVLLFYRGNPEQLIREFARYGLMIRNESGYWVLRRG